MSTSRSRVLARTAVIGIFASTAVFGMTGVASAHTGEISASCDAKTGKTEVTINLTKYNGGVQNTWVLTDNGQKLAEGTFKEGHRQTWADQDGSVAHKYAVKIVAGDGPNNKDWSFTKYAEAAACKKVVPPTTPPVVTTTTTPPASTTTPPAATTVPPVTTTTTTTASVAPTSTAAPVPAEDDLADTGASIALPLAIGGVLVLGGAGALIAVRRRASNS